MCIYMLYMYTCIDILWSIHIEKKPYVHGRTDARTCQRTDAAAGADLHSWIVKATRRDVGTDKDAGRSIAEPIALLLAAALRQP